MQVIVAVKTKDQIFPKGTAQAVFLFSCQLQDAAGASATDPVQQKSAALEATFDLSAGDYVATVSCLGASASSAVFTVVEGPPTGDTLQVPDVITVQVGAPAAPPSPAA